MRFSSDIDSVYAWIAEKWCQLFDRWITNPEKFVFDDGFAALFFVRVLWAERTVLLRGQYDSRWKLTTTLFRAKQKGSEFARRESERAQHFTSEILKLSIVQSAYPSGITPEHQQALLQHYGFPTDLIDCTFSFDIALYFAEGGYDNLPSPNPNTDCGAIYAFPTTSIPKNALVITIPPAIMRPSLQQGAFLSGLSDEERSRLEKAKFVFKHQSLPVWNGLGAIPFAAPIGLGKYLFPVSDPIATIARPFREALFTDNPTGIWLSEIMHRCLGESSGGTSTVDMQLLIQMIKGEPSNAKIALKILCDGLQTSTVLSGEPISEATGHELVWRRLLAAIYIAYSIANDVTDRVPPDLQVLVDSNPIILECAQYEAKQILANTEWLTEKQLPRSK